MGERRLRAELQQPDVGRRRACRPLWAQARVHHRLGGVRAGFAAVRPVSEPGLAERRAGGSGRGGCGAAAQLAGHSAAGFCRCASAGAGHRPVGRHFRGGSGGRAGVGWRAGGCAGLAGDLLDQSAGRAGRVAADRALGARVPRRYPAATGRGRAGAGHGVPGRPVVRLDRRPCAGLDRAVHLAGWRCHRVGRWTLCLVGRPRDPAADSDGLLPPASLYRCQYGCGPDELRRHGPAVRHESVLPACAGLVGSAGRGAAERDVPALRGAGVLWRALGRALWCALDGRGRPGAHGHCLPRPGACASTDAVPGDGALVAAGRTGSGAGHACCGACGHRRRAAGTRRHGLGGEQHRAAGGRRTGHRLARRLPAFPHRGYGWHRCSAAGGCTGSAGRGIHRGLGAALSASTEDEPNALCPLLCSNYASRMQRERRGGGAGPFRFFLCFHWATGAADDGRQVAS